MIQRADPQAGIDLGAITKGYIADRIKDYLEEEGVRHAMINLGGNVLAMGGRATAPIIIWVSRSPLMRPESL